MPWVQEPPRRKERLYARCYAGLGDNLYAAPFVRALAPQYEQAWVQTPWPELYQSIPGVLFVKHDEPYRTQQKHMARFPTEFWSPKPRKPYDVWCPNDFWRNGEPIMETMARNTPVRLSRVAFDLADMGPSPEAGDYAVIRPVTVRREWMNPARNPRPEYINRASEILHAQGLRVVSVADIQSPKEVLAGGLPFADQYYHKGELKLDQLLALIQHARVVVGGVGWIVPACLFAKVPCVVIGGGWGYYSDMGRLTSAHLDCSHIGWITPDNWCAKCKDMKHECPKEITNFDRRFERTLDKILMRQAA